MMNFATITAATPCAILGMGAVAADAQATEKPNIVIIYTDDMGVGDVSFLSGG